MAMAHFYQGGRKIEVVEDDAHVIIHAANEGDALDAAADANVELDAPKVAASGLVRATLRGDRDAGMARLRKNRVVHHLYRDTRDPKNEYVVTDTFYVKFKQDTPRERITEYLQTESLKVTRDLGNGLLLVQVTNETGSNPLRAANRAQELYSSLVEYAEPNLVRKVERLNRYVPADTLFSKQWHLDTAEAAPDLVAGAGISAPEAWWLTRGSREIVVAVADDGFDLTHPDFAHPGKVADSWNLVPDGPDFRVDADVSPRAGDYHGTPCAGVAIAESDGRGVVGVAPGCAFLAVRFPLSMDDDHFLLMFERISRVADVVSCSWGYGPGDVPMNSAFSARLSELTKHGGRRGKGLIICVAAGNNNCPIRDLENDKTYRYRQGNVIRSYSGPIDRWIAAHPDVITVSACTSLKRRSAYSSWGKQISVCAPSDNWDDLGQITTAGRGVVTTDNESLNPGSDFTPGSRFTDQFGGTSSATPTVAGVCALVLSRNPSLTAAQVKALLERTADKDLVIESETRVNVAGDFVEGFSEWFGHGKVNAHRAVVAALPQNVSNVVTARNTTELRIPDRDETVTSVVDFNEQRLITDLRVSVKIKHTYIGDLRIALVGPDGGAVTLHDHEGGSNDNLDRTYSTANVPALSAFLGKPLGGRWSLAVVDSWLLDEGKLVSWSITAKVTVPLQPAANPNGSPKRKAPAPQALAASAREG